MNVENKFNQYHVVIMGISSALRVTQESLNMLIALVATNYPGFIGEIK
jgi:hypothetical protein